MHLRRVTAASFMPVPLWAIEVTTKAMSDARTSLQPWHGAFKH